MRGIGVLIVLLFTGFAAGRNELLWQAPGSKSQASIRMELNDLGLAEHYDTREIDLAAETAGTLPYTAVANEFQLIGAHNIKILDATNDMYMITSVSPLSISNNEIITVDYHTSNPQTSDWIGAYSPIPTDITTTVPVKFGYCDRAASYMDSTSSYYGTGTLHFNMTNLRDDIVFYYFTGGTYHPVMANNTLYTFVVSFRNANEPLRPRIVPTGDNDVFKLLWNSLSSTDPLLEWGLSPGVYISSVQAATSHIEQTDMCGYPANTTGWRDLGLIHTALFVGMLYHANQKVYYRYGDRATNDYSNETVFFVPPLPGQQPSSTGTRIILYDDLGRGTTDDTYTWNEYGRPSIYTIMSVGAEVATGAVSAVYHGGDISYATGYAAVWDFFLDMISPVAGSVIYLTTVGNHESDWPGTATIFSGHDSGGECGVCATTLLPQPSPAIRDAPWWSYDVGLIHMVGMSTEHDFTIGSNQYNWLEADLMSVDRTVTPWIIFGGHRAMYINSDYGGSKASDIAVMNSLITNIEPLLWKYRVTIGFYGHNHQVQRHSAVLNKTVIQASTPVIDGVTGEITHWHRDPQATVHMVVGTGGARFTENAILGAQAPAWNEMYMYEYGYARVTAVNATYLDWEWINAFDQSVMDHMVLTQPSSPPASWTLPSTSSSSSSSSKPYAQTVTGIFTIIVCVSVGVIVLYATYCYLEQYLAKRKSQDGDVLLTQGSSSSSSSAPSPPLSPFGIESATIVESEDV